MFQRAPSRWFMQFTVWGLWLSVTTLMYFLCFPGPRSLVRSMLQELFLRSLTQQPSCLGLTRSKAEDAGCKLHCGLHPRSVELRRIRELCKELAEPSAKVSMCLSGYMDPKGASQSITLRFVHAIFLRVPCGKDSWLNVTVPYVLCTTCGTAVGYTFRFISAISRGLENVCGHFTLFAIAMPLQVVWTARVGCKCFTAGRARLRSATARICG